MALLDRGLGIFNLRLGHILERNLYGDALARFYNAQVDLWKAGVAFEKARGARQRTL